MRRSSDVASPSVPSASWVPTSTSGTASSSCPTWCWPGERRSAREPASFPSHPLAMNRRISNIAGESSELRIGRNCIIREGVTMNPGTAAGGLLTSVGDRSVFLAQSHVAHDCRVGSEVIFSNNVMLAGHCSVGDYAILGGGAAVHQYVRLGRHSFIGGSGRCRTRRDPLWHRARQPRSSCGAQRRRTEAPGFLARGHPRSSPGLSAAVLGVRHTEGARRGDGNGIRPDHAQAAEILTFLREGGERAICVPREGRDAE